MKNSAGKEPAEDVALERVNSAASDTTAALHRIYMDMLKVSAQQVPAGTGGQSPAQPLA